MSDLDAKTIQKLRSRMKRLAATEWVHEHAHSLYTGEPKGDSDSCVVNEGGIIEDKQVIHSSKETSADTIIAKDTTHNILEAAQKVGVQPDHEHRTKRSRIVDRHMDTQNAREWMCCGVIYSDQGILRQHMARIHAKELEEHTEELLSRECKRLSSEYAKLRGEKWAMPTDYTVPIEWPDVNSYTESGIERSDSDHEKKSSTQTPTNIEHIGTAPKDSSACTLSDKRSLGSATSIVLLFYKYVPVSDPVALRNWYQHTCESLQMTGKVRVASEGINVTVAGTTTSTERFVKAQLAHPITQLVERDIKRSVASLHPSDVFDALTVNVHPEIVPMGVHSGPEMNASTGGKHLSPAEFHELVQKKLASNTTSKFTRKTLEEDANEAGSATDVDDDSSKPDDIVLVDCRNFYESAIGHFETSVRPNIRKFKYWPEYVDRNEELFRNKTVAMYCTGGIRCELGSAYLMKKGIAKEVVQLDGGIHRYMEEYPDGHYKGKLFVFDNRQTVVSKTKAESESLITDVKGELSASNDSTVDCRISAASGDVLGQCSRCQRSYDEYAACENEGCSLLILVCEECRAQISPSKVVCCDSCEESEHGRCACVSQRQRVALEV